MGLRFEVIEGIPTDEATLSGVLALNSKVFQSATADTLREQLPRRTSLLVVVAFEADAVIGYKIGYEQNNRQFHSWLGGVDPEYRGRGIATQLMRLQHEWCFSHGYNTIRTHTTNKWRSMLLLNIRNGFDVIGTVTEGGKTKIILEKTLQYQQ